MKKLISAILILAMLLALTVPAYAVSSSGSSKGSGSSVLSAISDFAAKRALRVLFGNDDFYNNQ